MHLDRDEFEVTYDPTQAATSDLIAIVAKAGYAAQIAADERASPAAVTPVDYSELFPELFRRAGAEEKPVVLSFGASWCIPCQRMARETLADPTVKELLNRCIFAKIDTDEQPEVSRRAGVDGLPDVRFVSAGGKEVKRITSFLGPELFADELRRLLGDAPTEAARAKEPAKLYDLAADAREFRAAFNAAKGQVRVVMLVSPG